MGAAYVVKHVSDASLRALNHDPDVDQLRRRPRGAKGWESVPLGKLVEELGKTYAKVLLRVDCSPPYGDELLSQVDLFAAEPVGRRIRGDLMAFGEDLRIKRGDVLIAGAGQMGEGNLFGRSLVADDRLAGRLAAGDLFADPDSDRALYVAAFLSTRAGLQGIRSTAYGTSIPRMRPDLLAALPVPIPDDAIQHRVANLVRRALSQREAYLRGLRNARAAIEALPDMQEAHQMCASRRSRAAAWTGPLPTLSAWNFASAGRALGFLLKSWKSRVSDLVPPNGIFRGGRFPRISCSPPHGIDFLSQRDVFAIRPISRRIVEPPDARGSVFVPDFSLLVGGQGTLGEGEIFGQVALVTPDIAQAGITEHLLRVQPNERSGSALLYAFFSTLVGRRLLRSTGVGTKLLSLRPDLVLALPVPDADPKLVATTLAHLEAASRARNGATTDEKAAVAIVEGEVLAQWRV